MRPVLTGDVAEQFDNAIFASKEFGTNFIREKCDQSYDEANKTLTEIRGKLLKMGAWESFERNFCHFDFEIVNHRRYESPVDLFDLKGERFLMFLLIIIS